MADFPNAVYAPRTKANAPGVVYDAAKTTVGFAEDVQKLDDEVVAIENALEDTLSLPRWLLAVPVADGTAVGKITSSFNCGFSSSAIGDIVYLDVNGTWQKADNTTSVATYSGLLGVALEVKASGAALKVLLKGFVYATAFPALTVGSPVYLSTGGAVVVAQPSGSDNAIRVLGHGVHADKMFFNPSPDYIVHI